MFGPSRPVEGGELHAYITVAPAAHALVAAVERYRWDIDVPIRSRLTAAAIRAELAGLSLACWCPLDRPCHADVLLAIANEWPCPTCRPKRRYSDPECRHVPIAGPA
jgi:hypothetical protein